MFHFQTNVNGFPPERIHGQRGRAVTHGISDFRGVEPGGEAIRIFDVDGAKQRLARRRLRVRRLAGPADHRGRLGLRASAPNGFGARSA